MTKHKIEYFLVRLVAHSAMSMSLKNALLTGDIIGDLFYFIIRIRRRVALNNLRQAFGRYKNERELKQILHQNYRHFGRMIMEFARMPLFTRATIFKHLPMNNRELLDELLHQHKGLIILSGHFGNWEYLAGALANVGTPFYCVFQQQKNIAVDAMIKKYRMDIGMLPLKVRGGAAKGVASALKNKAMVFIVIDQDADKIGTFINFFGKPASTAKGPATIAIRYRIPVLMAFGVRGDNGRIHIEFHKFSDIESFSDDDNGVIQFLTEYNIILETYIRQYPEQWFWMHRRWKTPAPSSN